MKKLLAALCLIFAASGAFSQGTLTGDFLLNANFYQRDSLINAANNPLYDNLLSGGEAWLTLRYNYKGFTAYLRTDVFNNSNLYSPGTPYNGFGIGAWSLSKDFNRLGITAGYIYDQIGSGILFRAYEDRGLLIDNALVGVRLKYKLTQRINLKGFTGQQKGIPTGNLNNRYNPIIKGFNAEGDYSIGKAQLAPGIGILNRTLDQQSIDNVAANINSQELVTRFVPRYNMYAFTAYNTLTLGNFSWYVEGAYKTHEAIVSNTNTLVDKPGNVAYTTIGYARKGIAVNLTGKRTEAFVMRTSPNESLIRGILNWQPIVARLRPQRLMARYTPASQDLSEVAGGADVLVAPNDNISLTFNYTHINTLDNVKLYREAYAEAEFRNFTKWIINVGAQALEYNQELYQTKPGVPLVRALTPFVEASYRFTDNQSLRAEVEYMRTDQDYGNWVFALVEYNIAPKWSFSLSDMYITKLNPENPSHLGTAQHYYNAFVARTQGPHRFTLAYVKQVDGINCTGGVCRYEPAFSGVRFTVTSSF